jgi:hypothetical protein
LATVEGDADVSADTYMTTFNFVVEGSGPVRPYAIGGGGWSNTNIDASNPLVAVELQSESNSTPPMRCSSGRPMRGSAA